MALLWSSLPCPLFPPAPSLKVLFHPLQNDLTFACSISFCVLRRLMCWILVQLQCWFQGWDSRRVCYFAIRSRDLFCPLRGLNNVDQDSVGLSQAPRMWFVTFWNCEDDGILFPNILPVSALVQMCNFKTLEVTTVLGTCLFYPTHPATHQYPASAQICGWYFKQLFNHKQDLKHVQEP